MTGQQILLTDPTVIANCFGDFWSQIPNKLRANSNQINDDSVHKLIPIASNLFKFDNTHSLKELTSILKHFKNKNNRSPDNIPMTVLKHGLLSCGGIFLSVLESCFSEGCFPSNLKSSLVIPIYKGGDMFDYNNYRPVSLLSAFSKVYEKYIHKKMLSFIKKYSILCPEQNGFRSGFSTSSATSGAVHDIMCKMDGKFFVAGLFFDLTKAFDLLVHWILFMKLDKSGFRGNIKTLIQSFLTPRSFKVLINSAKSKDFFLNCGVPQGSILGPLLFLIYINDLPAWLKQRCPNCVIYLYADDASVIVYANSPEELEIYVNLVCHAFNEWCEANGLVINSSKSVSIVFSKRKLDRPLTFCINSNSLMTVPFTKLLGLIIDRDFKFTEHVDYVVKKLNTTYHLLRKLKSFNSQATLLMLYYGWAYPYLVNHILCWGTRPNAKRVFILQKRIVRLIFGIAPRSSAKSSFQNNKILTLACLFIFQACKVVVEVPDKFVKAGTVHDRNTRNKDKLYPPSCKTALFKSAPFNISINCFNSLPSMLVSKSSDIDIFGKELKKYLQTKAYYNMQEFFNDKQT